MGFKERKAHRTQHYFKHVHKWRLRTCSACGGSGRYDTAGSPQCGACNGSGKERYRAICMCELNDDSCDLCRELMK